MVLGRALAGIVMAVSDRGMTLGGAANFGGAEVRFQTGGAFGCGDVSSSIARLTMQATL